MLLVIPVVLLPPNIIALVLLIFSIVKPVVGGIHSPNTVGMIHSPKTLVYSKLAHPLG